MESRRAGDVVGGVTPPFAQRDLVAQSLGIPHGNLRVISPYIGGGFGGKVGISIEANVVLMASGAGHPVKVRMSREEEFVATNVRQSLVGKYKIGCDKDGNLLAMEPPTTSAGARTTTTA